LSQDSGADNREAEPDSREAVAPVDRAAGARGDFAVIRDMLPFLRPYIGRITIALLLIVAAKLANLTVPFILKEIVDQLNVEPSLLVLPVALLVAYGAARISVTLFNELRQVVFIRVMARASREITLRCFAICMA
jgi:ATP-binding cassette, subfamily B, heavy metal transporter